MAYSLSSNLTNLNDRGLAEAFMGGMASSMVDMSFMRVFPWDNRTYDAAMYAPPSEYSDHNEGEDISTEAVEETYNRSITVAEYKAGYACSYTARVTMRREVLVGLFRELGALAARFYSKEAFDLLNNATGTTTTADGVALGSASHLSAAGLQSNYLNASLSHANYSAAVKLLLDQKNHRGTIMGGRPTNVYVPTALRVTAAQILTATHAADDLSQPNIERGNGGLTVAPDLTASATRWFVMDQMQTSFRAPTVRGPAPWEIQNEQKSLRYEVRDLIAAAFGVIDWRGVVVG